jgi:Family of unknown function (DUF6256)
MLFHLLGLSVGQGAAGAEPGSAWDVLRHDVIPVGAAYLVFLGILVAYRRTKRESPRTSTRARDLRRRGWLIMRGSEDRPSPPWIDLLRYLVAMAAGGYAFFLAIVLVFYFVLGGEDWAFIRQALVEGSVLAFLVVLPAFALLSWLEDLLRSHGRRSAKR